jgi:hypothetical protein
MPRPIFTPLSGRDRRFAARELATAREFYKARMRAYEQARASADRTAVAAGEAQLVADRLFCEAWHAAMFCGGPAQPSPTIAMAINCGFGVLDVQCSRCGGNRDVDLDQVRRPRDVPLWKLEASLNCDRCRTETGRRTQAYIIGLKRSQPDPEPPPALAARAARGG